MQDGKKVQAKWNVHNTELCCVCVCVSGLGMQAQSQASVYTISVGTESLPNYPWAFE